MLRLLRVSGAELFHEALDLFQKGLVQRGDLQLAHSRACGGPLGSSCQCYPHDRWSQGSSSAGNVIYLESKTKTLLPVSLNENSKMHFMYLKQSRGRANTVIITSKVCSTLAGSALGPRTSSTIYPHFSLQLESTANSISYVNQRYFANYSICTYQTI